MASEIIVDCETTGLDHREGHRIIELSALVLEHNRTGRQWQNFFDPCREIEPGAIAVHGITNAMVRGAPKFETMAEDFLTFVEGATLIAHNAPFDKGFIEMEMWRCKKPFQAKWIDTLAMARKKVPGRKHTLDALCRHFKISIAERSKHAALLDCKLLAQVYVNLTGRNAQLALDVHGRRIYCPGGDWFTMVECEMAHPGPRPIPLPSRLTLEELRAHKRFMEEIKGAQHDHEGRNG